MTTPLRMLITSDWHADASTAGFDRFEDIARAVDETVGWARDHACTHYLFLGDLTDPDESRWARAVHLASRTAFALHDAGIASKWLVGNHDVIEDGSGSHTLSALAALDAEIDCRVYAAPRAGVFSGTNVDYVALPFVPRSHAYDPDLFVRQVAARKLADTSRRVVVFGHLNVEGVTPGSETEDMPRGRDVFFPLDACREVFGDRALLLNGHYHRAQVHEGVHIPGALERLTFGEADHRPGFLVLEVGRG